MGEQCAQSLMRLGLCRPPSAEWRSWRQTAAMTPVGPALSRAAGLLGRVVTRVLTIAGLVLGAGQGTHGAQLPPDRAPTPRPSEYRP